MERLHWDTLDGRDSYRSVLVVVLPGHLPEESGCTGPQTPPSRGKWCELFDEQRVPSIWGLFTDSVTVGVTGPRVTIRPSSRRRLTRESEALLSKRSFFSFTSTGPDRVPGFLQKAPETPIGTDKSLRRRLSFYPQSDTHGGIEGV